MSKHAKTIGIIIVLGLVIIAVGIFVQMKNKQAGSHLNNGNESVTTNQSSGNNASAQSLAPFTFDNLVVGQSISLPVTITGTVPGNWFFEGSFPVFLKDNVGNQIGVALAHTNQDWMTTNTIPFSVTLPATNYQGSGTLVFTKDNPSGEPQFDASVSVNVVFQ